MSEVFWASGPFRIILPAAIGALMSLVSHEASACASCGCTLSSDAAMGYSASAGWRLDLRYDYIDQSQLRSGTGTASPAQVVNNPSTGELENQTINRYLTMGLSYNPSADWNVNLLIPYVIRRHSSYTDTTSAPFDASQLNPVNLSGSASSSPGDVKVIGSYQGLVPTHNLGLQLGVKLPTGSYGNAVNFSTGPAAGTPLDTSLQPGTGSTDLIVGAYYYQAISQDWDAFVNASFQGAVMQRLDQPGNDYRPGNLASLSFGLRYEADPKWVPQLQVNLSHKGADRGALADTLDTAGTVVYLSPGITVSVLKNLRLYGFFQLPAYSNLDGYQISPRWTATVGLSHVL